MIRAKQVSRALELGENQHSANNKTGDDNAVFTKTLERFRLFEVGEEEAKRKDPDDESDKIAEQKWTEVGGEIGTSSRGDK